MAQTKKPYARLGEQVDRLVRSLALENNWRLDKTITHIAEISGYSEATVYRWRQGRLRPPENAETPGDPAPQA